jgi:superfamily I DNA/RNA helicase
MYTYAEKYNKHKQDLKQVYESKKDEGLVFEPQINQKSIKIVENTAKTFSERTMESYLNKYQRQERDKNEIDFEK